MLFYKRKRGQASGQIWLQRELQVALFYQNALGHLKQDWIFVHFTVAAICDCSLADHLQVARLRAEQYFLLADFPIIEGQFQPDPS